MQSIHKTHALPSEWPRMCASSSVFSSSMFYGQPNIFLMATAAGFVTSLGGCTLNLAEVVLVKVASVEGACAQVEFAGAKFNEKVLVEAVYVRVMCMVVEASI